MHMQKMISISISRFYLAAVLGTIDLVCVWRSSRIRCIGMDDIQKQEHGEASEISNLLTGWTDNIVIAWNRHQATGRWNRFTGMRSLIKLEKRGLINSD